MVARREGGWRGRCGEGGGPGERGGRVCLKMDGEGG
jgi:hypothetical protein